MRKLMNDDLKYLTLYASPLSTEQETLLGTLMNNQDIAPVINYHKPDATVFCKTYPNGYHYRTALYDDLRNALANGWDVQINIPDLPQIVLTPRLKTPALPMMPAVNTQANDFVSAMRRIVALAATDPVLNAPELNHLERSWGECHALLWLLEALESDERTAANITRYLLSSNAYDSAMGRRSADLLSACAEMLHAPTVLEMLLQNETSVRSRPKLITHVITCLGDIALEQMMAYCESHPEDTIAVHGHETLSSTLRVHLADQAATNPRAASIILQGDMTADLIRRIASEKLVFAIPRLVTALDTYSVQMLALEALIEMGQNDCLVEWLNRPGKERSPGLTKIALRHLFATLDDIRFILPALTIKDQTLDIVEEAVQADNPKCLPLLNIAANQADSSHGNTNHIRIVAMHGLSRLDHLTEEQSVWLLKIADLSSPQTTPRHAHLALALINAGQPCISLLVQKLAKLPMEREIRDSWYEQVAETWFKTTLPVPRQHMWSFMETLAKSAHDAFATQHETVFAHLMKLIAKIPHPACVEYLHQTVAAGKKRNGNFNLALKACETAQG